MVRIEEDDVATIFSRLNKRSTGGTSVVSMAAPALSTQFVKSSHRARAGPNSEGSFAEVILPSRQEIEERILKKHKRKVTFGYTTTKAAAAYPAGYGERSARALAREDNVYQLKGTFPSAVLSLAKLRARTEARGGDIDAVNRIFARMWGLLESHVLELPQLHVEGSESTRMAAMEDRAYHALSGHPAHVGGFRIDTATVAPDVIGPLTPLNWPRIRTGLKAIAVVQLQGDLEISSLREKLDYDEPLKFRMGWTVNSQPTYIRPSPWEGIIDRLMEHVDGGDEEQGMIPRDHDLGHYMRATFTDAYISKLVDAGSLRIRTNVEQMAKMVSEMSNRALAKTIQVIEATEMERALIEDEEEEDFDTMDDSTLSMKFHVPKYRVTRSTMRVGVESERLGADGLPDVRSHGVGKLRLKMSEMREVGITNQMNIAGALNMAVYILINRRSSAMHAYTLMSKVKDPGPKGTGSVVARLRRSTLYEGEEIRALGRHLFGDEFISILDTILRNVALMAPKTDQGIRDEMWKYLCTRYGKYRECPFRGGWRDLLAEVIHMPEGWTLFYWARVSIGKLHATMSNSILAPIAAGEAVDFLSLIRKSVKEHALRWSQWYTAEYTSLLKQTTEERAESRKKLQAKSEALEDEVERHVKYVPPHLRQETHLDLVYDEQQILNRRTGLGQGTYQRMVMMQAKSKVFAKISAISMDREIVVGISDEEMRQIQIEFYQGRWYSLDKRIKYHQERNSVFKLGQLELPVHPWGELVTEFPQSLAGVNHFLTTLDNRVWTVPPTYMWMKLKTSISELWQDISREIDEIKTYIDSIESDQHECMDQDELEARLGLEATSLVGKAPIILPTPGYRQYHAMPERQAAIVKHGQKDVAEYTSESFVEPVREPSDDDDDDYGAIEEMDEDDMDMDSLIMASSKLVTMSQSRLLPEIENKYMSYNEIWAELELDDVPDNRKCLAFGIAFDTDLSGAHLDPTYGPIVTFDERPKTRRMWANKIAGMRFRLGHRIDVDVEDDM